eukprot:1606584-Rhodomonas_salina.2
MPVPAFENMEPYVRPCMPYTGLQVDPSSLTPRQILSHNTSGSPDQRMLEYDAPIFPDGTPLPPDVCALLGFPYGTISRGLNLTFSMLEQIKMQKMGIAPSTPQRTQSATPTSSTYSQETMYSQETTPYQTSAPSSWGSAPPMGEQTQKNLMSSFEASSSSTLTAQDFSHLQKASACTDQSSATEQSSNPTAKFEQSEVERDWCESEDTVMLPCCRSCLPRKKTEEALKHSTTCPCCHYSGVTASMLIPLDKKAKEEESSRVVMPCCRSKVPHHPQAAFRFRALPLTK